MLRFHPCLRRCYRIAREIDTLSLPGPAPCIWPLGTNVFIDAGSGAIRRYQFSSEMDAAQAYDKITIFIERRRERRAGIFTARTPEPAPQVRRIA